MEKEKYILIFEGKYLNNNKKGREYDDKGRLLFVGEYLNGKYYNRKIKNYDENGDVIFEGENINEKLIKGRGKREEEYNYGSQIIPYIFDGEYINGEKWIWKDLFEKWLIII